MTVGIEIFNTNGNVLIDSVRQNYSLMAEGTLNVNSFSGIKVDFPVTVDTLPLVFVRCSSTSKYVGIRSLTTSSVIFNVFGSVATSSPDFFRPVAGTFDYRIYCISKSLPLIGNSGLQVFDDAGNLVFNSNRPMPIVKETLLIGSLMSRPSNGFKEITSGGLSHNAGSNPWMMINCSLHTYGFIQLSATQPERLTPAFSSQPGGTVTMALVSGGQAAGNYWPQDSRMKIVVPLMIK